MKMKNVTAFLLFLIMLSIFETPSFANIDEYGKDWLEASGANGLSEYLTDETSGYLKKLGCEDIEFEKIFNISLSSVTELIKDIFTEEINEPLKCLFRTAGTVMLISVCSGFFPDDEKTRTVLNLICGSFLITEIFVPAINSIGAVVSAMSACAAFEKVLIPVLAAIVTVSGNPSTALSSQGIMFAAAQFVETLAADIVMPLVGVCGALNLTGAVLPTLRLSAVSETVRKTATVFLTCASALFTGFLSLKNILASTADGMIIKGVKLASNTFVPVIGGALGEAYTSVVGSLSIIRKTVGVYAIIVFFVITVPVIINLALWVVSLRLACMISDLLDCRQCSEVIKGIAFIFSTVNVILLLCAAVFIISSGIVVFIGTGG